MYMYVNIHVSLPSDILLETLRGVFEIFCYQFLVNRSAKATNFFICPKAMLIQNTVFPRIETAVTKHFGSIVPRFEFEGRLLYEGQLLIFHHCKV